MADEKQYKIVRKYSGGREDEVVRRYVTLAEAREHCSDPETSSDTCKLAENVKRTRTCGPWFDAFYPE